MQGGEIPLNCHTGSKTQHNSDSKETKALLLEVTRHTYDARASVVHGSRSSEVSNLGLLSVKQLSDNKATPSYIQHLNYQYSSNTTYQSLTIQSLVKPSP